MVTPVDARVLFGARSVCVVGVCIVSVDVAVTGVGSFVGSLWVGSRWQRGRLVGGLAGGIDGVRARQPM